MAWGLSRQREFGAQKDSSELDRMGRELEKSSMPPSPITGLMVTAPCNGACCGYGFLEACR